MADPAPRLPGAPFELNGVGRKYCEIRGSFGQLTAFLAVWKGVKPVMDDWIPAERLDEFYAFSRKLGLWVELDSLFRTIEDDREAHRTVGGDRLNTTRAFGFPPWLRVKHGLLAHVFLSRRQDLLTRARDCGWYPLVVDSRVLEKPWIDHYEFGELLGYPSCCRRFFAFHNEWNCRTRFPSRAVSKW